jgi:uncharacterized membrane protein YjjP (DUF1212 family)
MQDEDFDRACRFLNTLVVAAQCYGVSSSAIESLLARAARAVHVRAEFLVTPTQVQSILWEGDDDRQRLHISVSSAGNYDMTKLSQISELVGELESGSTTPGAGLDRLRAIDRADPEYGPGLDAVAFALCGIGFGVILGISWLDVLLGGALSVVSFGLARLPARSRGLTTALELVVAAVASVLATLLALVFPGSHALAVAVCACIYFVPGFGLTLGANELMGGYTLSGLIGFTRAVVTAVKLVIGTLIGSAIVRGWATASLPDVGHGVPHTWTWLFAPVLVLGLAILFRVRRRDLVWPVLGGLVVWLGVEAGSGLGFWQGTFIGAFLLLSASRLFAQASGLPAVIILLPAVMVLVPGVAALRALYVGQTLGLVDGLRSTSEVIVLIAAILGGMLLGEAIWSIRGVAISTVTSRLTRRKSGHR